MLLSMADLSIASELAAIPKDLETVHFISLPGESGGGEGEGGGGDGSGGVGSASPPSSDSSPPSAAGSHVLDIVSQSSLAH